MRSKHLVLFLVLISLGLAFFIFKLLLEDSITKGNLELPHRQLYNSWKRCMTAKTDAFIEDRTETWEDMEFAVRDCDLPFIDLLKLQDFTNGDETKRHIMPYHSSSSQTVVTIGIGHDTRAEEQLLLVAQKRNMSIQFYGADPMAEINEQLYSKFGHFFPFAITAEPGTSMAYVLQEHYVNKTVIHLDPVYFLSKLIRKKVVDTLWLDAEWAEYSLFPFFKRGGLFDQNGIIICQMNIEIHEPDRKQLELARSFFQQILYDERYGFFAPVKGKHYRLFFVNFEDQECVEKYIPKDISNVKLSY